MNLHPVRALDHVIEEYRDYLLTEFRAKDPALQAALERELDAPGFLAREPFFQAHRPFRSERRWRELPVDAQFARVMEARRGQRLRLPASVGGYLAPARPGRGAARGHHRDG